MKLKELFEKYGDKKYGLGKSTPEDDEHKTKTMDKHRAALKELIGKHKEAEDSGDYDAADKHEAAIKLHKAKMTNDSTYLKGKDKNAQKEK